MSLSPTRRQPSEWVSVFWEGDFDVDELIAGALAVGARIVQSSALKLFTKPARFATVRSAIPVSCGRFQI
jgi:hypothetical protein